MLDTELDLLSNIAGAMIADRHLTAAERVEVLRIGQGFACKDSAAAANVSPETIRARRKRIYRKLGLAGAGETLSHLLAASLQRLAQPTAHRFEEAPRSDAHDAGGAAATVH